MEIVESRRIDSSKNEILQNLKTSVEEMHLIKEGRLEAVNVLINILGYIEAGVSIRENKFI